MSRWILRDETEQPAAISLLQGRADDEQMIVRRVLEYRGRVKDLREQLGRSWVGPKAVVTAGCVVIVESDSSIRGVDGITPE